MSKCCGGCYKELGFLERSNPENIEHVLRDCDFADAVWLAGLGLRVCEAPVTSFWILGVAQNMSKQAFDLCLMLVSSIWGARNALLLHGNLIPSPMKILIATESRLQEYHKWHSPDRSRKA
ncbi:hypothetical protein ACFX13_027837 [Malus domestica]